MELPPPFGSDLKVLVLAGSDPASPRRRSDPGSPLSDKAFLRLRGRLVIEYVLDLLRERGFERVWVLASARHLALIPREYRLHAHHAAAGRELLREPVGGDERAGSGRGRTDSGRLRRSSAADAERAARLSCALRRTARACGLVSCAGADGAGPGVRRVVRANVRAHARDVRTCDWLHSRASPSRLRGLNVLGELYEVRKLERFDSLLACCSSCRGCWDRNAPRALVDAVLVFLAKEMEKAGRGSSGVARAARSLESWFSARVPVRRLERYAARVLGAERGMRVIPWPTAVSPSTWTLPKSSRR